MRIKFLLAAILNLTIALTLLTGCKKESSIDPSSSTDPSLNKSIGVTPTSPTGGTITPDLVTGNQFWVFYNNQLIHVSIDGVTVDQPNNVKGLIYNTDQGSLAMPFKLVLNSLPNNSLPNIGNGSYFRKMQYGFINRLKDLQQFYSESQILSASVGKNPIINLLLTDEVYKIS